MAYPVPKIEYNPGSGTVVLTFTFPPIGKAGTPELKAERNDSFSISGLKQSVFQRIDDLLPLQMDFVPLADLPAWDEFMRYALAGGLFNYFPDHTLAHFTTYTLEDTNYVPKRNFFGITKFALRLRKVFGPDQAGS